MSVFKYFEIPKQYDTIFIKYLWRCEIRMIKFDKVSKAYKDKKVLQNVSFEIAEGTITSIIGESGCGKTTTLKMINRLIEPTQGTITIKDQDIRKTNPIKLRRKIGYVIQQTGLFPHMTVRENIELISKLERKNPKKIKERTLEMMEMVALDPDEFLDRYPSELSGGQQQRIGIARAFATDPEIILMDEPFSALDPMTRVSLQDELLRLQEKFHKTIVFVTHDMDEAIKISDKIAIMEQGKLIQYDTPEMILKHPADEFVKNFVGKKRIWTSPSLIKVEDIMIENPITGRGEFSIFYCLNKMKMARVDSLMIVDDNKILKGILYAASLTSGDFSDKRANEFIENDFVSAKLGDSIVDLLKIVDANKVSTIPVTDEKGVLKGIITRSSLITSLSQQFLEGEGE